MRRFTKTLVGEFARLMAAGWLFQALLPALCCCCCFCGGITTAYGSDEVFYSPVPCCCQMLAGRLGVANQGAVSCSGAECQGATCTTCESYGCHRGSDSRQSTLRRRQLEDSEKTITNLVLHCLDIPSDRDSHWPSPTLADASDKGAALSAAERCVSLQRLVL